MAKYEIVCYGSDGAAVAVIETNSIEDAIDSLEPRVVKIIVHDGETGNYITEA
jgi:hypothetical protein